MIARLSGKIISKTSTEIVIDCGGVGYLAFISLNTSSLLPEPGEAAVLLTHLIPGEDSFKLFGFAEEEERQAFKILISVSGVGPKIAISVLSSLTVRDLQEYILTGNINALQKLPGIGKKTAERLHIELKDKISKLEITGKTPLDNVSGLIKNEAVSALITLGYSSAIADRAVRKVLESDASGGISAEKLIRLALKVAMNG